MAAPAALASLAMHEFAPYLVAAPAALVQLTLTGLSGGAFAVVAPTYVAETSDPDIRGKLSAGFDMGLAIGFSYASDQLQQRNLLKCRATSRG